MNFKRESIPVFIGNSIPIKAILKTSHGPTRSQQYLLNRMEIRNTLL